MSDSRPIALFDSGIGGLSILMKIKKKLPYENIIYLADQAYFPYGEKSELQLQKRASKVAKFLIQNNAKILVVACNTASLYSLSNLRNKVKIPIIGVVPAIKPAIKSRTRKIGIMATPASFKNADFNNLIKSFAQKKHIIKIKSKGLEHAIENYDSKKIVSILKKSLSNINDLKVDTLVLGCTHYPLAKKQIRQILGSQVALIDSHGAIAKRVNNVLKSEKIYSHTKQSDIYFTTGNVSEFSMIASKLLKTKIQAQEASI